MGLKRYEMWLKSNPAEWNYWACKLHGEQCTHSKVIAAVTWQILHGPPLSFTLDGAIKPGLCYYERGREKKKEVVFEHEVEKRDTVTEEEAVRGGIISQGVDVEF